MNTKDLIKRLQFIKEDGIDPEEMYKSIEKLINSLEYRYKPYVIMLNDLKKRILNPPSRNTKTNRRIFKEAVDLFIVDMSYWRYQNPDDMSPADQRQIAKKRVLYEKVQNVQEKVPKVREIYTQIDDLKKQLYMMHEKLTKLTSDISDICKDNEDVDKYDSRGVK